MDCQVFADKIYVLVRILLDLFDLYRLVGTGSYAFGKFPVGAYAIIALGIKIGYKILEYYPERAGNRA
jgi:hypothetical protein